jgi:glycosyltransferase involved in cell wall biosynthesis
VIDRSHPLRSGIRLVADTWQRRRAAPDVVYANQYHDSLFARALSIRFGRPFVCHVRLAPPDRFCGQYRWGMRGAHRLIAISHALRQQYADGGVDARRIDVVYNGIDVAEWRPVDRQTARQLLRLPDHAVVVGFAGRIHHQKGIDVLIDALTRLPQGWRAAIAGSNHDDGAGRDYERELRARAAERGVANRVHWLGHVANPSVFYSALDVAVLPAVLPEGFGRAIVEAMACGTPVVASRTGGIPEILTGEFERGLCEPRDAASLVESLQAVRVWRSSDEDLPARCRAHVEKRFAIADTVTAVEAVFEGVVAQWRDGRRTGRGFAELPSGAGA